MDYSYLGSGKIYLREVGSAAGLVEVGNASALSLAISEEIKEQKDFTQTGGGTMNEVRRISSVEVSMTVHNLSPQNLSRALYGSVDASEAGTVTDESHTAYVGAFIKTNFPATTITAVKEGVTTLVEGTDYEIVPGGITVKSGGALIDGDTVLITYTKAPADIVQALTSSGKEYELVFIGLNEARSGKQTSVHLYRAKLGAAQNLGLIGDDYAGLEMGGKVLKDTSKTGAGVSQYFKAEIVR
jgi:hypothetical protein